LTRSKKASSSCVAAVVVFGGRGSGRTGVKVGETACASGATDLLCVNFVLYCAWFILAVVLNPTREESCLPLHRRDQSL
jgi:hypothetical protein